MHTEDSPQTSRLDAQSLESRIQTLISDYQASRSISLAKEVLIHLRLLWSHPDREDASLSPCDYRRLYSHWQRLAFQGVPGRGC